MADWRKLAMSALLADGVIDEQEVKVIKKELLADGKIDRKELEFLVELRTQAQKKAKGAALNGAFENFFFKVLHDNILADGSISAKEAGWLRNVLFADGHIDEGEKKFLKRLKGAAKKTAAQFDALYEECMSGGTAKAATRRGASHTTKAKKAPPAAAAPAPAPAPVEPAAPAPVEGGMTP